jgi:hypothetical protein
MLPNDLHCFFFLFFPCLNLHNIVVWMPGAGPIQTTPQLTTRTQDLISEQAGQQEEEKEEEEEGKPG